MSLMLLVPLVVPGTPIKGDFSLSEPLPFTSQVLSASNQFTKNPFIPQWTVPQQTIGLVLLGLASAEVLSESKPILLPFILGTILFPRQSSEEQLLEAIKQCEEAGRTFKRQKWFMAMKLYHAVIPQFRKLARRSPQPVSTRARRLMIHASEQEHRAWIEVSQRENLQTLQKSLKQMAAIRGLPSSRVSYTEKTLAPGPMINIQGKEPVGRLVVDYRKSELQEGLAIRVVAIRSDNRDDESRGRIFILDGHHRARAAFELNIPIQTFLFTVPSVIAEEYARQARLPTGKWLTVSEMPFEEDVPNAIKLSEALVEIKTNLSLYDRAKRSAYPLMVNFERRGRFMTWEDIRDHIPTLERESMSKSPTIYAYRLQDGRLRIVNTQTYVEKPVWQKLMRHLTMPMKVAIVNDATRRTQKKFDVGDIRIVDGRAEKAGIDAFTVGLKGTDVLYRVKPTQSHRPEVEIERSSIAELLHLGPRVVYAERVLNRDQSESGVIIREFYRYNTSLEIRGPLLTPVEQQVVGEQLAFKIYTMFDPKRTHRIVHRFDNLAENLFFLGLGRQLKVRFVDWRTEDEDLTEDREEAITKRFQKFIPIIQSFLTPLMLAHMLLSLQTLSKRDSDSEAAMYENAYQSVRSTLAVGSAGRDFFERVDQIRQNSPTLPQRKRNRIWRYFMLIPLVWGLNSVSPKIQAHSLVTAA